MVIKTEDIKKDGGRYCEGCPHFELEIIEGRGDGDLSVYVELACKNEEKCVDLYGHALERARDHYRQMRKAISKLP